MKNLFRHFISGAVCIAMVHCAYAQRNWQARWIAYPYEKPMGNFTRPTFPAPVFRKVFEMTKEVRNGRLFVCGLGFFTCELDGRRLSDARLTPAPTQYDKRWRYRVFDVGHLPAGRHIVSITAADGFYRASTPVYWHFEYASWTDYPKAILEIVDATTGDVILASDETWKVAFGPVVRTELRGGETHDANMELPWDETDGQRWRHARIVPGPGGIGEEEKFPQCRVTEVFPMERLAGTNIWIAPINMAGVPRISVRGESGAEVVLSCGEMQFRRDKYGNVNTNMLAFGGGKTLLKGQVDKYILSGRGEECWSPEFTYHGFQCVEIRVKGNVDILRVDALRIHTDFRRHGWFRTSDVKLSTIGECAIRSCLNNFVGIPTDCPHREKNGWTSEARLMCETLMYAFDAADAYRSYVDDIADAQRPNGQLPGMLPTGGVGYNWGSGPAWDAAFLLIPLSVFEFTGDLSSFEICYPGMKRYVDYCMTLLDGDGLMTFGLGDWMSPRGSRVTTFVTTAFYVRCLQVVAWFAERTGRSDDASRFNLMRSKSVHALLKKYYEGGGVFRCNSSVVPALALAFRIVPDQDRTACAAELARVVKANGARVDYGTIGSGCVLRELFENGYCDLAYEMMTQPDAPGYWNWFADWGMTTFPEDWYPERSSSNNHGAFADVAACMFRYLAGFRHAMAHPGRRFLVIRPCFPEKLQDFTASHEGYEVDWRRIEGKIVFRAVVPEGCRANLILPGRKDEPLREGTHLREIEVNRQ